MSGAFLDKMAAASRERVRRARQVVGESAIVERARSAPAAAPLNLSGSFDIIAELKLRSPAAGGLAPSSFDAADQISAYARGGACAVSVLTEPDEFEGSLSQLEEASRLLAPHQRPTMRKDFLVDPYQVVEARAHGAGGVLLIIAMLDDSLLQEMLAAADELGLFLLLEAFDTSDLERLRGLPLDDLRVPVLGGVNCRDLRSLQVDFSRFSALAQSLPTTVPVVAESGIGSPADIASVARAGYRMALIGSALMESAKPADTLAQMLAVGREAATGVH